VLLFSLHKTSDVTLGYIRSSIEECCEKYDLYAGLSYSFEDDAFIPLAYKQALKASLYAEPEEAGSRLCRYENYMLGDIMNASLRMYPAVMYEHPVLARLRAYDQEYGTKYVDTLRLYLEQFCNMKVTAAELGVHYNTIKYRLSMIEEISGQEIRNDITGENKPIDYNTDAMVFSKAASTIRGTVAQNIVNATAQDRGPGQGTVLCLDKTQGYGILEQGDGICLEKRDRRRKAEFIM
jgi:hypothetical protein